MPVQFVNNPLPVLNPGERHIPVVLLVDTSGSMSGSSINELNEGLVQFKDAINEDPLALGRAEVCVISFNSLVNVELDFCPATEYEAPVLTAGGLTALNEALLLALDKIEERKTLYRKCGISYYRPWVFLLTDGSATDTNLENLAKEKISTAIRDKKITFIPMAIGEAVDKGQLQDYYPEEMDVKVILSADRKYFKEAFIWLSQSIGTVSSGVVNRGDNTVSLPPTPSKITVGI